MMIQKPLKTVNKYRPGLIIIAIFLFLVVFYHFAGTSIFNESGVIGSINYNYICYLVSFIGSIITGIVVFFLSSQIVLDNPDNERLLVVIYTIFFFGFIIWLFLAYKSETTLFARDLLPRRFLRDQISSKIIWFLSAIFITYTIYLFIQNSLWDSINSTDLNRIIFRKSRYSLKRVMLACVIALTCAILTFAPNVYLIQEGGIYHADAYINSIINVAHYVPYDDTATSIYGHYGIVYLPFVKILGDRTLSVMLTICLFTAVMYMAIAYIIDYLVVNNDVLFFITLSAIAGVSTSYYGPGQYYQIYPHRILFPVLTICLLITDQYNNISNKLRALLAVVFGVIACLFNLETGLISIIVISIYAVERRIVSGIDDMVFSDSRCLLATGSKRDDTVMTV